MMKTVTNSQSTAKEHIKGCNGICQENHGMWIMLRFEIFLEQKRNHTLQKKLNKF